METISIKINGVQYDVPKGSTVLEAARAAKIEIPTLCYSITAYAQATLIPSCSIRQYNVSFCTNCNI